MTYHDTIARIPGLDIAVHSSVPQGAGLSSSAALETATALAIAELFGAATDDSGRRTLARDCITAENVVVGAATGGMDQSAALRAAPACDAPGLQHLWCGTPETRLPACGSGLSGDQHQRTAPAGRRILWAAAVSGGAGVRAHRPFGLLHTDDVDAVLNCARTDDPPLRRALRHVLTEIRRVSAVADLLRADEIAAIGHI